MVIKQNVSETVDGQVKAAPRAVLEDLFEDYYKNRHRLYVMNLIKGMYFGFGTALGGTLVVALVLWALSFFHYIPFLDGIVKAVENSLQQPR
jgi:hypothetical protein